MEGFRRLGLQQVRVQRDLQVPGIADLTLWPLPSQVTWYLLVEVPAQLILVSDTRIGTPALVFRLGYRSGHLVNDQVLGQKAGYLAAKLSVTCTWSQEPA